MAGERCVTFVLEGPPQGKGRARSTRSGIHYTPEKTANYETRIKWEFRKAVGNDWKPIEGPVAMMITAVFTPPKSYTKRQLEEIKTGKLYPTVKPDTDNILKIVADGLNSVAYVDDKQVVSVNVRKDYRLDLPAGLTITIREV